MAKERLLHKVQSVKGSYTIYLPKEWCEKNRISRGDEISLIDLEKALLAIPKKNLAESDNTIRITLDDSRSPKEIEIFLYSSYIEGFDNIEVVKDESIKLEERYLIKSILKRLFGVDIVYEDDRKLVIKEVTSLNDLSSLLTRSFQLIGLALDYLPTLIDGVGRAEVIEDVEEEIDRFYLAIQRKVNRIISFKELDSEISYVDAMYYLSVMEKLESISDYVRELVYEIENGNKVPKSIINDMSSFYHECLKAFNEGDLRKLINVIYSRHLICEKLLNSISDRVLLTHLTRILDCISDISKIMINTAIRSKEEVE